MGTIEGRLKAIFTLDRTSNTWCATTSVSTMRARVHRPTSSVQSRLSSSLLGGEYAVGESVIVGEIVDITAVGAGVSSALAPAWSPSRAATSNRL